MAALTPGRKAPAVSLADTSGQEMSLADPLKNGPVVLAFFKVTCPICQFTFPFIERIHKAFGTSKFTFWGISQDDARDTREFVKEYGIQFPILIEERGYAVSNQYGITNVPTIFLISPGGEIQISSVGFEKDALEKIASEAARATDKPASALFKPSEAIPAYKPG
jgi:peroxiredoxin